MPETAVRKYPYYIEKPLEHGRVKALLDVFAAVLEHSNYKFILDAYSRISMKCARCTSMCQVFEATNDPKDIPCYRTGILLDIYKRHFTLEGWLKDRLFGASRLTEENIDEMLEAYYRCTACRRCTLYCPMGIEHGLITHLSRYILSEIGIVPKALVASVRAQLDGPAKNTSAIPVPALLDTLEFLEEDMFDLYGIRAKFPIDVQGADYIFFAPVSDYLLEAETLMSMAVMFHLAGVSWTIGTGNFDGINYGLFYNDAVLGRCVRNVNAEVRRLGAKKILIGECGHASRVAKAFSATYNDGPPIPVVNIMEVTLGLIESGKLKVNPDIIKEKVTFHDPCNIARSGWVVEQPRKIIKTFIKDFVEMEPHGKFNLCCGGGSGLVSCDELKPFRMNAAGRKKADQIMATGAEIVITPCANCKKQMGEVIEHFNLPMQRLGLHELLIKAIVYEKEEPHAADA